MTPRERYVAGLVRIRAANDQLNKAMDDGNQEAAQRAQADRDAADEALLALRLPPQAGPLTVDEKFLNPARRRAAAERYGNAMQHADRLYADIVTALHAEGLTRASVWQTGGMCLAIGINLDQSATGWHALVGDADNGPLRWERAEPVVWELGIYAPDDEFVTVSNDKRITDPVAYAKQVAPLLRRLQAADAQGRWRIIREYER